VIVDKDGKTITTDGRTAVMEDPEGANFPWVPPTFADTMPDKLQGKDGEVSYASLAGKTIGIYFSAHWCPPCRGFTPELVKTYNKLKAEVKPFEIIFASSDRDEAAFNEYYGEMPWLTLPYADRAAKEKLSKVFGVEGIPSFHIIEHDGTVINNSGRGAVGGDPEGKDFPWHPKPINDLSSPDGINETPAVCILMEEADAGVQEDYKAALTAVAQPVFDAAKAKKGDPEMIFFYSTSDSGVSGQIRGMTNTTGKKVAMVLLDIPDNGGYYVSPAEEINQAAIENFIEMWKAKALDRQQLG